MEEEMYIHTYI